MIAKVCDRENRRDTWFENRLVFCKFLNFCLLFFLFSSVFLFSSFSFLPFLFLLPPSSGFIHISVWQFPQFSLSFPGSGAPRSCTLSIPDVCMCMYVVFCKIDHCIHIHWCIVMGLGHNDPWVESHMWPQQTWGQRSSRGQWPLVQVFGKRVSVSTYFDVFSNLILQWLQKYVIAKTGETRGSRTALSSVSFSISAYYFFYSPLFFCSPLFLFFLFSFFFLPLLVLFISQCDNFLNFPCHFLGAVLPAPALYPSLVSGPKIWDKYPYTLAYGISVPRGSFLAIYSKQ